ncbi:sodium:calcium antiporter [Rhizomicrobium electricum]|jgi:cation:H+ antiporter|uniref:Calcium/sodium antiporter n=1 Tax=Rhizomicrobium electricum TaxID=480070 RepID=A0ABP3PSB5_9PROT|nr:sodium:calcium antiporter [Rhizomicrobium electricum]NIJ48827.1 cation:H+ antiporter [Rhizomicrobium electricum]
MAHGVLIAAFLLVLIGSELAVRGGVGLARWFDVPPLVTGILVVAVLTVAPELFVTFRAVTMGRPEMALGGLIGSNILNLLFVMGLGALIHPMASPPKVVFRDGGALLLAALGLIGCALAGGVSRVAGALMLAAFAGYVVLVFATDWRRAPEHSVPLARALFRSEGPMPSTTGSFVVLVLGFIMIALGAHLGVVGAINFAAELGWSETTIGLIVISAGLSSPKLLLTLWSAVRGHTSVAVGQLAGAGVFSFTLVLGLIALFWPMAFPAALASRDVYILAAIALVLMPLLAMRWRLSRPRGILLILAYGCYLAFVLWRQGLPLPWEF